MFGGIKIEGGRRLQSAPKPGTRAAALAATGMIVILGGAILLSGADKSMAEAPASFSERFSFATPERACPTNGWPYIKAECLRMADGSRARSVRIIAIDRAIGRPAASGRAVALAN
jgi:hypothetical protein